MSENLSLHGHALPYSRPNTPGLAPQLGFVGVGSIGYFMAKNLASHQAQATGSHPLLVWNRSPGKPQALVKELGQDKIRIAQTLEQIATECDVIFTVLSNDGVVKSIYEAFTKALTHAPPSRNKLFVECSTIFPTFAGELDSMISSIPHTHLITCPVFGNPAVAEKAQLLIAMSGDYRSKKEAAYLLVPAVGRKVIDLGGNIEKAPTLKLVGNSMILGFIEVMAESYTLAQTSGIDSDVVQDLIKELFPAPIVMSYSDKLANDKFDGGVGFAIDGGIKDASHIRRLTAERNSPMPVIDVAHQHMITARAIHTAETNQGNALFDTLDWSGLIAGTRVAAGLDGFDRAKHTRVVRDD